ncbi:hypothetical protein [Rhizobium laguerreae]|uniref:hypothetical protein n=1 Tax=Rhizobium laguerreae TaxID=1076926 RepID=UPI001C905BD5|nr:hypothetical protein [Rhizobium laguerreae]MBY3366132.1 hypothetical protein [Rhizobium laguerreae]
MNGAASSRPFLFNPPFFFSNPMMVEDDTQRKSRTLGASGFEWPWRRKGAAQGWEEERKKRQNALCFSFRAFTSSPSRRSAEIVEATDTMNMTLMRAVSIVKIVNIGIPFLGSCVLAPQYWPSTAVRAEA